MATFCDDCSTLGIPMQSITHDPMWMMLVFVASALIAWSVFKCYTLQAKWVDAIRLAVSKNGLNHRYQWLAAHYIIGFVTVVIACSSICGFLKFTEILPAYAGCLLPDDMIYATCSNFITVTTAAQALLWVIGKTRKIRP